LTSIAVNNRFCALFLFSNFQRDVEIQGCFTIRNKLAEQDEWDILVDLFARPDFLFVFSERILK